MHTHSMRLRWFVPVLALFVGGCAVYDSAYYAQDPYATTADPYATYGYYQAQPPVYVAPSRTYYGNYQYYSAPQPYYGRPVVVPRPGYGNRPPAYHQDRYYGGNRPAQRPNHGGGNRHDNSQAQWDHHQSTNRPTSPPIARPQPLPSQGRTLQPQAAPSAPRQAPPPAWLQRREN